MTTRLHWLPVIVLCLSLQLTPGYVQRVIDGDTFILYAIRVPAEERVRLLGVDAPERGQPGFEEAKAFVETWLALGSWRLMACKRDSFGRLLGTAMRAGESLGDALVAAGLGVKSQ